MIHSLSGGVLSDFEVYSFAKVEFAEGADKGKRYWYRNEFPLLKAGDEVVVPYGRERVRAKVVLIEENSAQTAPVPLNRIKAIERVL